MDKIKDIEQKRSSKKSLMERLIEGSQSLVKIVKKIAPKRADLREIVQDALGFSEENAQYVKEAYTEVASANLDRGSQLIKEYSAEFPPTPLEVKPLLDEVHKLRRISILASIISKPLTRSPDEIKHDELFKLEARIKDYKIRQGESSSDDFALEGKTGAEKDQVERNIMEVRKEARLRLTNGIHPENWDAVLRFVKGKDEEVGEPLLDDLEFPSWYTAEQKNNEYNYMCSVLEKVRSATSQWVNKKASIRKGKEGMAVDWREQVAVEIMHRYGKEATGVAYLVSRSGGDAARYIAGWIQQRANILQIGSNPPTEQKVQNSLAVLLPRSLSQMGSIVPVESKELELIKTEYNAILSDMKLLYTPSRGGMSTSLDDIVVAYLKPLKRREDLLKEELGLEEIEIAEYVREKLREIAYPLLKEQRDRLRAEVEEDKLEKQSITEIYHTRGFMKASGATVSRVSRPFVAVARPFAPAVAGVALGYITLFNPAGLRMLKLEFTPYARTKQGTLVVEKGEYKRGEKKTYESFASAGAQALKDFNDYLNGKFENVDKLAETSDKLKSDVDTSMRNQNQLTDEMNKIKDQLRIKNKYDNKPKGR